MCVICLAEPRSVVLMPCCHLCLCLACAEADTTLLCALCRRPVESMTRVYQ